MYVVWSIMNELYGLIVWLQTVLGSGASMIGLAEGGRKDLINREAAAELATRGEAACEVRVRIGAPPCVRLDLGTIWMPALGPLAPS